jgi:hypothetical protein
MVHRTPGSWIESLCEPNRNIIACLDAGRDARPSRPVRQHLRSRSRVGVQAGRRRMCLAPSVFNVGRLAEEVVGKYGNPAEPDTAELGDHVIATATLTIGSSRERSSQTIERSA